MSFKTYISVTSLLVGSLFGDEVSPLKAHGFDPETVFEDCQRSGLISDVNMQKELEDFEKCFKGYSRKYDNTNSFKQGRYSVADLNRVCSAYTRLEDCLEPLLKMLEPCLTEEMKEVLYPMKDTMYQLIDFVCVKEKDRITQFIAEDGLKCFFSENGEAVKSCIAHNLPARLTTSRRQLELRDLSLDEKECRKLIPLRECVVGAVRTCPQPASTIIVNSVTNIVLRNSPCKDLADGAAAACGVLALLAGGAALALLL